MSPVRPNAELFPITLERGITRRISMTLSMRGEPVDLTGYTARLQVREDARSNDVMLELSTENGGIEIDGPDGLITLIFAADKAGVVTFAAEYDMVISEAGESVRLIYGPITPVQTITRGAA